MRSKYPTYYNPVAMEEVELTEKNKKDTVFYLVSAGKVSNKNQPDPSIKEKSTYKTLFGKIRHPVTQQTEEKLFKIRALPKETIEKLYYDPETRETEFWIINQKKIFNEKKFSFIFPENKLTESAFTAAQIKEYVSLDPKKTSPNGKFNKSLSQGLISDWQTGVMRDWDAQNDLITQHQGTSNTRHPASREFFNNQENGMQYDQTLQGIHSNSFFRQQASPSRALWALANAGYPVGPIATRENSLQSYQNSQRNDPFSFFTQRYSSHPHSAYILEIDRLQADYSFRRGH